MLRSLFAAVSGLRANQTMLDVTGNNIANSNTAGFKSSGVVFEDTLSQMLTGASAPSNAPGSAGAAAQATQGGTNPVQVGLGVQLAGTTTNFTQGSAETTGRATDLMISGDGMFVIQHNGEQLYTRAGAFDFDSAGNLVTQNGDPVLGTVGSGSTGPTAPASGNLKPITISDLAGAGGSSGSGPQLTSYSIGSDGVITGVYADDTTKPLAQIAMADFANPDGLEKVGDTAYRSSANSGTAQIGAPGSGQMGKLTGGELEASNVDLAQEFTNLIIAQRGFQANARVITTSDQVLQELVNLKQ